MPYIIVRTDLSAGIGYEQLHRRLRRTSPPIDFRISGDGGLYRITTDDEVALDLVKKRIDKKGYELIAIDAPYDGQIED